jgi:hypothetical protein
MTTLTFSFESGKGYVADAIVNSDFNLHLEKEQIGLVSVYVSTVDSANKVKAYETSDKIIDYDFDGIVYPKYVTVCSIKPVTSGVITEN